MNKYLCKAKRIESHLAEHPSDWQSKLSYFKAIDDNFRYIAHQKKIEKLKALSEFRRELNAKS